MSEIGLKRTDLLNNDSIAGNKRFDGLSSGARRVATGGDVRGTDRDRAVEALRDREVASGEHNGPLHVLKSRRMPGSNPVCKFVPGSAPFWLRECHIGSEGIRIGSVRVAREAFGRGPGGSRARPQAVLSTNVLQFGKQAT